MPGKKNRVCARFRAAVSAVPSCPPAIVLSVITSYACQSPPDMDSALRVVQRIAKGEEGGSAGGGVNGGKPVTAEKALHHLSLLCDVDKLFDVALGLYDFPLVRKRRGWSSGGACDWELSRVHGHVCVWRVNCRAKGLALPFACTPGKRGFIIVCCPMGHAFCVVFGSGFVGCAKDAKGPQGVHGAAQVFAPTADGR